MKIQIILCGQPRNLNIIINQLQILFDQHELSLIIVLNKESEMYADKIYFNKKIDYSSLINQKIIKSLCLINDIHTDEYRNVLNYTKKIKISGQLIDDGQDIYIVMRSDVFIISPFINNIVEKDVVYFCNNGTNQFVANYENKLNCDLIVTKNFKHVNELCLIYDYITSGNINYLELLIYKYVESKNINYVSIEINYKLVLSLCNIIAISGDSGSGKSILAKLIEPLFGQGTVFQLETDRYHKWERGDPNYKIYSHLNPEANYLEKMNSDVYQLKIGNQIYAVDYLHSTGKFSQTETIKSSENLILCGLHTLYSDKINQIIDLKVFMDTDFELLVKWKIDRDVVNRGYTIEKILNQIQSRDVDRKLYIETQKKNADVIIKFYEQTELVLCKLYIKINLLNKIMRLINDNNYKYILGTDDYFDYFTINLSNDSDVKNKITNYTNGLNINIDDNLIYSGFNGELQLIFLNLIYNQ